MKRFKIMMRRMNRFKLIGATAFAASLAALGSGESWGDQPAPNAEIKAETKKPAALKRREAGQRLQAEMDVRGLKPPAPKLLAPKSTAKKLAAPVSPIGPVNIDLGKPNFAFSPNLRKFVDSLPGLGAANKNNLGQYIPVADPDTTTYPGSDYYEIRLAQYRQQLHSDLPGACTTDATGATTCTGPAGGTPLRGYYQANNGTAFGASTDHVQQYLGPLVIARRDRPVRFKFVNELGLGSAGDLPFPVDTTVMGSGMGPLDATGAPCDPTLPGAACAMYTQNRADIHLHGGLTPWISDGTPHQWITPAGDPTPFKKGDSFQNVPDMVGPGKSIPSPAPGDGMATYYYPNQQSARLMFYHDHSYGITRLNVYAGEAAGYLLTDPAEEDLINRGILPNQGTPSGVYRYGIPLVIQDRSFVNDAATAAATSAQLPAGAAATPLTADVDPLWKWGPGGNLWFPHEYIPNENVFDPSGFNAMGRWDYGPFMIPPMLVKDNVLPSPTLIPEAYGDTPIVNGTAFPYVTIPPQPLRFRILNACNDRVLNLQLYYAKDKNGAICKGGTVFDKGSCTEVSMVAASPRSDFPAWPRDGRDGGVPDPNTAGPSLIQIGNEGGFLVQPFVVPPQPIDFDYNRRSVTFGGVTSKSLLMMPAFRSDVIADFSSIAPGSVLILYNDAPAPMPLYDSRNDYFTGAPDQTPAGGAPPTPAGFGPNTRTIMQIRIDPAGTPSAPFNLTALQNELPLAYAKSQDPPIVPASAYNAAYNTVYPDVYANSVDETLNVTGTAQPLSQVITTLPGLGYTTPPTVSFIGGNCSTQPAATAALNGITGITLVTAGSGYTSAPTVTITPARGGGAGGGGGAGATAVATVSGGVVTAVSITNPGSGYLVAPTVTFSGGGAATQATATATITLGTVGAITLTNKGVCTKAPLVLLTGGGGSGAGASAMLAGDMVMTGKNLVEGFDLMFGRMNAVLGSTPNPLAPTVGAGPVIGAAGYIDPPTEILADNQPVLWRISHIGVDSHAIHFHLFNVQVVNRVDWTNTIKPPYPDELGWKETIRTNPFEDIIVAIKPASMLLPFTIPNSSRLLDPTTPLNSTSNFLPVAPPPGIPAVAQTTNLVTNFNWEYVWHCHLLGHEENDMMRPISLVVVPPAPPSTLSGTSGYVNGQIAVTLSWRDNSVNEASFTIQRATNGTFTAGLASFNVANNVTSYTDTDPALLSNTVYYYRLCANNGAGSSAWSNTRSVTTVAGPPPPGGLTATIAAVAPLSVTLNWTNNNLPANIQRATDTAFTLNLQNFVVPAGSATYVDGAVTAGATYYYRIQNPGSLWSLPLTVRVVAPPAPTGLRVTAAASPAPATTDQATLTWAASGSIGSFTIQRSTSRNFGAGTVTIPIANGTLRSYTDTGLAVRTRYYYQISATNAAGTSPYSASVNVTTP